MSRLPLAVLALALGPLCGALEIDEALWASYKRCDVAFPHSSLVCDPDGLLNGRRRADIERLLFDLQTKAPCICPDRSECIRREGVIETAYAAAMLVVPELPKSPETLEDSARSVYNHLGMGTEGCDNGILLLYSANGTHDALYDYRGALTYYAIPEGRAESHVPEARIQAYTYRLRGGKDRSWEAQTGMAIAAAIALAAAVAATAILLYRVCGRTSTEKELRSLKRATAQLPPPQPMGQLPPPPSFHSSLHSKDETAPSSGSTTGSPVYYVSEPSGAGSLSRPALRYFGTARHSPSLSRPDSVLNSRGKETKTASVDLIDEE